MTILQVLIQRSALWIHIFPPQHAPVIDPKHSCPKFSLLQTQVQVFDGIEKVAQFDSLCLYVFSANLDLGVGIRLREFDVLISSPLTCVTTGLLPSKSDICPNRGSPTVPSATDLDPNMYV